MRLTMERKLELRFVLFAFVSLLVLQALIVGISLFHSFRALTLKADRVISEILTLEDTAEAEDAKYFILTHSNDSSDVEIDVSHAGLISKARVSEYTEKVLSDRGEKGYVDSYRYRIERTKESVKIVFLSRKLQLESWLSYAMTLVVISSLGILLMTLFAFLVSKKVVSPLVKNREKQKAFITSSSHSLKTPLTVISADSQLLECEIGKNEWLEDIIKQTEKMTDMTNRLVSLSRIEEKTDSLTMIEFPISDIAYEIASSYKAVALSSNKTYSITIEPALGYKGDEKDIEELMTALLDNAFKYSDEMGLIDVELKKKGRYISFSVENTAEKKALENSNHFTERFYRGDTSDKNKGYGIGLSVAEAVCSEHHGRLIVEKTGENRIKITAYLKRIM